MALKPSHAWWHPKRAIGSLQEAARAGGWKHPQHPGKWVKVLRTFCQGNTENWWALEVVTGPYGPEKPERVVIATTDPLTLPELSTCYLVTNLPAPGTSREKEEQVAATLEEVVRLYGLRMWVEQSYKQVKHTLGWSQYQVRSDKAIRRHWQLVCCAFSFCWYHASHASAQEGEREIPQQQEDVCPPRSVSAETTGRRKKNRPTGPGKRGTTSALLAEGSAGSTRLVGALGHAPTLLARLVRSPPPFGVAAPS